MMSESASRVVTLCGSTRFEPEFAEWSSRLTLAGYVVLSVEVFSHTADGVEPSPEQIAVLMRVHRAKIDMCDEVFFLDVGGYIGDGGREEIAYAKKMQKPIRYLSTNPGWRPEV